MAGRPPSLITIDYVFTNRKSSLRRGRMPSSIRHTTKAPKTSRGRWSNSIEHLRTEARKSIWFAFQTLLGPQNEKVQIHTLKVLTSSLGNALGIERSEDLHNQTDQTELDFVSYFHILETLMFEPLSKASDETMDLSNIDYQHVHNVCWVLFYNHDKGKTLPDDIPENIAFKMWMLFNLFCEEDDSNTPIFPLKIDPEEATIIFDAILTQTGKKQQILSETEKGLGDEPLSYQRYIAVFFVHIFKNIREAVLKSSVEMVFEQLVYDILKKGSMLKRGHQVKSWKERYMVLNPTEMKYYVSSHQKHLKGTIVFDKTHSVEQLPDKGGGKRNLFVLNTPQKPYEMSAIDMNTRNEWISAIQVALDNCENPNYHHHKELAKARRLRRNELRHEKEEERRKRREEEENFKRIEEEHKLKEHMNEEMLRERLKELEDERKARAELEAQLKEQEAQRELERKRLMELEALNAELERLLELERQAKRDEETVRKLQAKLLEEESEKREELERLKMEQEELLKEEREKREGLEGKWEEKKKSLADATAKLLALENEREEASKQLQEAAEKLQEAEKERHKMEEKVKLWKTPNVGLARPLPPKYQAPVTHRGKGAFCEADFLKKARQQDKERGLSTAQLDEKYGKISDDEEGGMKSPNKTKTDIDKDRSSRGAECTGVAKNEPTSPSEVLNTDDKEQLQNMDPSSSKHTNNIDLNGKELESKIPVLENTEDNDDTQQLDSNENECQQRQKSEPDKSKIQQEKWQLRKSYENCKQHSDNDLKNVEKKESGPHPDSNSNTFNELKAQNSSQDSCHEETRRESFSPQNSTSNEEEILSSVESENENKQFSDSVENNETNSNVPDLLKKDSNSESETIPGTTNDDNVPSSIYENVNLSGVSFKVTDSTDGNESVENDNVSEQVRNNTAESEEQEIIKTETHQTNRNSENDFSENDDSVVEEKSLIKDTDEEEVNNSETTIITDSQGPETSAFSNDLYCDINSEDFVKTSDCTRKVSSDTYENVQLRTEN